MIKSKCNLILQNSTAPANIPGTVAGDGMKLFYADGGNVRVGMEDNINYYEG